jgi:hypothetical protein
MDMEILSPTIIAAIISASGGILEKIIELSGKSEPNAQAKKTMAKSYEKLMLAVTTNSVRVLIALRQAGSKQSLGQIASVVEPMRQRQEPNGDAFEADLNYRLKFLCLLGLVQPTQNEYALTHLGAAFLARAREDTLNYSKAIVV